MTPLFIELTVEVNVLVTESLELNDVVVKVFVTGSEASKLIPEYVRFKAVVPTGTIGGSVS